MQSTGASFQWEKGAGRQAGAEQEPSSLPDNWQTWPGNTSFQLALLLQRVSFEPRLIANNEMKKNQFDLLFDVHFVIFVFHDNFPKLANIKYL